LSQVAWQCCLFSLFVCVNNTCDRHHFTCISQFAWNVPSWKLCTWTSSVSMQFDDCVVSTPHICVVPCKVYRWGGIQWYYIYIDFHKHWFINVCNVSCVMHIFCNLFAAWLNIRNDKFMMWQSLMTAQMN
jgi:hypothetical protein